MKLEKFRIYNYKSIRDSGYCSLANDVTILIGKNESGKTAVLEALRDFDKGILEILPEAYPVDESDVTPLIEMCFKVEKEDLEQIQADSTVKIPEDIMQAILENGLTVTKDSRGQYTVKDKTLEQLFISDVQRQNQEKINNIKLAKGKLDELLPGHSLPGLALDGDLNNTQHTVKKIISSVKSFLPSITDPKAQEQIIEALRVVIEESRDLQDQNQNCKASLTESVIKRLPNFIFINEFSGTLPFEIPISAVKENQSVRDFAKIANLDLDQVINTHDLQRRINLLNKHSAIFSGQLLEHWQQNQIELSVKPEGDKLLFGVKEKDKTDFFKIEQRSKGFQWFLSFYLRMNMQKSKNNVIVIDEPGMHLHAKAQQEILRVLETKITSEAQVVFSTHSPFFIDPLRLDRIRAVVKDGKKGSRLWYHTEQGLDEETLAPVSTALIMNRPRKLPLPEATPDALTKPQEEIPSESREAITPETKMSEAGKGELGQGREGLFAVESSAEKPAELQQEQPPEQQEGIGDTEQPSGSSDKAQTRRAFFSFLKNK